MDDRLTRRLSVDSVSTRLKRGQDPAYMPTHPLSVDSLSFIETIVGDILFCRPVVANLWLLFRSLIF